MLAAIAALPCNNIEATRHCFKGIAVHAGICAPVPLAAAAGFSTSLTCCCHSHRYFGPATRSWEGSRRPRPPMTLAFIRWTGAAIILLPFAARHIAHDWPVIRKHAVIMLLLSFTGFSIYNTMAYYGLQYTTAINGLLLQSIAPLFVAIWTFALFRRPIDIPAGRGCVRLADRRCRHHLSRQPRSAASDRLQPGRPDVRGRAAGL